MSAYVKRGTGPTVPLSSGPLSQLAAQLPPSVWEMVHLLVKHQGTLAQEHVQTVVLQRRQGQWGVKMSCD